MGVIALSSRLLVEIRRDGHVFRQEYARGAPQAPPKGVRDCTLAVVA